MTHLRMNGGDLNTSKKTSRSNKSFEQYLYIFKNIQTRSQGFPLHHFLRENPLDEVEEHSLLSFGNLPAPQSLA